MKKFIFDYARKCKAKISGGLRCFGFKRLKRSVEGIVIHNTGNVGDSAKNNCDFFATGNNRQASAHIFIDRDGLSGRSLPLNTIAFSVGNPNNSYARGPYSTMLNNANTVSIELCDIIGQPVSEKQKETLIEVCRWIKKHCPNVRYVVRHYDIVKKNCPEYYVKNEKEWLKLRKAICMELDI